MRKTYIKGTNVLNLGPGYGFKDYFFPLVKSFKQYLNDIV